MLSRLTSVLCSDPVLRFYSSLLSFTPPLLPSSSRATLHKEYESWVLQVERILLKIHPRFLLAARISRLIYSPVSHPSIPYDLSYGYSFIPTISSFATIANKSFSFLSHRSAFSWFSGWCSILGSCFEYLPSHLLNPSTITEFGPGAGFLPLILSSYFPSCKYNLFDIPVMSSLQKALYNHISKLGYPIPFNRLNFCNLPEDLPSIEGINYFLAFWSFSESPEELREQFVSRFLDTDVIIIVSNQAIFSVDNFSYFGDLSASLPLHIYKCLPIPLDSGYNGYITRHTIHLYYKTS